MALVGGLIGLPMFFEIGLVLLILVIILVTRRTELPLMKVGIPALAGLSVMHALVPPHPGPLATIGLVKADLGITLGLGVVVAIPTLAVAGPLFSTLAAKWVPVGAPALFVSANGDEQGHSGIAPSSAELWHHAGHRAAARRAHDGQGFRGHLLGHRQPGLHR